MPKVGRDTIRRTADREKPDSLKRIAPKPGEKTRDELAEREERWGVTTAYRLRPATKEAVVLAARMHEVEIGYLADFLLRAGLTLLSQGRIDLPLADADVQKQTPHKLKLPPVPEDYQ